MNTTENQSYAFSFDSEEGYKRGGKSREEAATEATKIDPHTEVVWTANIFVPPRVLNTEKILDQVSEDATEEAPDWVDDHPPDLSLDQPNDLKTALQPAWDSWEENKKPHWFNVPEPARHVIEKQ